MPVTEKKPRQFSFILTDAEHRMLNDLAEADGRSAANWLRMVIFREHKLKPLRGTSVGDQIAKHDVSLLRPTRRRASKTKGGR
jgi:hypothetical protein